MIIAYHAIFTTYGTWLPERSARVLLPGDLQRRIGGIRGDSLRPQNPQPDRQAIRRFRVAAMPRLSRPPYYFTNDTRRVVADAFATVVARLASERARLRDHERSRAFSCVAVEIHDRVSGQSTQRRGNASAWAGSNAMDERLLEGVYQRRIGVAGRGTVRRGQSRSGGIETATVGFCDAVAARRLGRRAGGR